MKIFMDNNLLEMTRNILKNNFVAWLFLRDLRKPADDLLGLLADCSFIENENSTFFDKLYQLGLPIYSDDSLVVDVFDIKTANKIAKLNVGTHLEYMILILLWIIRIIKV